MMRTQATTPKLDFWQVDVFTDRPLRGNPLGVVFQADDLNACARQAIARETNLSEVVFLLTPSRAADFALRIHTVRREIPFAVHPAIGAAQAYAEFTGTTKAQLTMECAAGPVVIKRDDTAPGWFVRVPDARFTPTSVTGADAACWLGLPAAAVLTGTAEVVDAGVPWLMVELDAIAHLSKLNLDHKAIAAATRASSAVGVTVFARSAAPRISARMRTFAPAEGIFEDPVCGSCAASLAALLRRDDCALANARLIAFEQGNEISRHGLVYTLRLGDGQAVGGEAVVVMQGHMSSGV